MRRTEPPEWPRWTLRDRLYEHFDYLRRRYWHGYKVANRHDRCWNLGDRRGTDRVLDDIKRKLSLPDFGIALEMGCHRGRLTPAVRKHSKEIWGVDLYPVCCAP